MTPRVAVVLTFPALIFWTWFLIALCPERCRCNADRYVYYSHQISKNVPVIYIKDVRNLNVDYNNLTCLRKDSFLYMGLAQLDTIYIDYCEIVFPCGDRGIRIVPP